jgi:hypothetical protein
VLRVDWFDEEGRCSGALHPLLNLWFVGCRAEADRTWGSDLRMSRHKPRPVQSGNQYSVKYKSKGRTLMLRIASYAVEA